MPTKRHSYNFPTKIEYGPGAVKDLVGIIVSKGLKKGLLVADKGVTAAGLSEKVLSYFKTGNIEMTQFDDVKPNPVDANVFDGVKAYKNAGAEFIVGLGGGSPLDVAKTIKVMVVHDGPLEQYDDTKDGWKLIVNPMPPFYAVPTTAGTGSEVGRSSVITCKSTNKKTIIFAPTMMPDIAVLDPELTVTLPAGLTAATGVDAFVHNLEAYIMDTFHPMADGMAKEAMISIFKNLPIAVKDGSNLAARGEMLMASAMGATAFQKGLGVNHSIAHALGVYYDTHHGLANAAILVEVMKYNIANEGVKAKLANLGALMGTDKDANAFLKLLENWLHSLRLPTDLKSINITADQVVKIEEYAMDDPCRPLNPRKVENGDVTKIVQALI